ncbi:MAG: 30S ribosomal protein S3 [Candidatus Methanogaster sp.]|uniref:30S ribosomal protein S3 n=1 Tax=Candidatus Methanogaster sp. TaxID=3386292 RepID=A0AC61L5H7_9EURY|nr:MAG: 30S ribosomal protein S3 [ANME-2 cluster archaeon]
MTVERKFVQQGLNRARMDEYFSGELERAGYAGMEINRTPMGTQITIFAEKPGMVIGKGGKVVRKLTKDMDQYYDLDNPQIDVQSVGVPELNAQLMASRIASALERGWYFRKAAHSTLRRIIGAGAIGCRIVLSGKLTGPRSRIEKVVEGYIVHAGKPAEEIVNHGFATAVRKLGTIGCSVQIVLPGTVLPDVFSLVEVEPPEPVIVEETEIATAEEIIGAEVEITEVEVATEAEMTITEVEITDESTTEVVGAGLPTSDITQTPSPVETEGIPAEIPSKPETRNADGIWEHRHDDLDWHAMAIAHKQVKPGKPEEAIAIEEETRMKDGVTEHKHTGFDYWHPASRIHKGA